MTRRGFLASSLGSAGSLAFPQTRPVARPNILLILSDDLGWNDVGFHNAEVRTPRIDALAARGLRLEQYRSMSVCSPTRAALLTGRSAFRVGVPAPIPMNEALPIGERLLPEMLSAAGYQTALLGKWHLGTISERHLPHRRGFDSHYGYHGGQTGYFTHRVGDRLDWFRNGEPVEEEGYTTDLLTAEAIRFLRERDKTRPFFLDLSLNAPHTPLEAQAEVLARYAHVADETRRPFLALLESMDTAIGRVLDVLDQEALTNDTLVIWASDNGGQLNAGGTNTPLRGAKSSAFEGGLRVPAVASWPGRLPEGQVHYDMVTVLDWLPTFAEVIGFDPGGVELDGVSVWKSLAEGKTVERGPVVLGGGTNACVYRGDFKYVEQVMGQTTTRFLFRIWDDPYEERNVLADHPEEAAALQRILAAHPRGQADRP